MSDIFSGGYVNGEATGDIGNNLCVSKNEKCCVLLLGRGIRSEKIQLRTRIPQGKNIKTSGEEAKFV